LLKALARKEKAMFCWLKEVFAPTRARLLQNKRVRAHFGALLQDFEAQEGEVFYGNLTSAEFDQLPLRTKRKGRPAYVSRYFSEPARGAKDMSRVFGYTYEERYKDKESCGVFVHTSELDRIKIEY
jgi:hypothetical protein